MQTKKYFHLAILFSLYDFWHESSILGGEQKMFLDNFWPYFPDFLHYCTSLGDFENCTIMPKNCE